MSAHKFNLRGKMTLTVHCGRNLANRLLVGKMDPYVNIHISGSKDEKFKTKVVKDGHTSPVWEQSYIFNLEGNEELLHANVYSAGTLGDDHIGRLDLTLDALDMSGQKHWYQIKDKSDFTKQTGEIQMTIVFDGTGLPEDSTAFKTNQQRLHANDQHTPVPAVSPQPQQYQSQQPDVNHPPVATIAPPVVQQQYQSQQPPVYTQPPPQQPQYQSQAPVYASQQPQYQQPQYHPPQQPVYQQPPPVTYGAPPMQPIYQSQQPIYQQPAPIVYQTQPQVMYQTQPQVVYTQQPQVVYQQSAQIIGYWPNGQIFDEQPTLTLDQQPISLVVSFQESE